MRSSSTAGSGSRTMVSGAVSNRNVPMPGTNNEWPSGDR